MAKESNCLTQDLLIGLLQDSLSKEQQLRAAEHVQTCQICQKELETICEQRKIELPETTSVDSEKSQGSVAEWSGKLAQKLMAELQQDGPSVTNPESVDPPSMATIISNEEEPSATEQTVERGAVDSETSVTKKHVSGSNSPTELHIAEMFGRYKVEKILGQGAMGAVYLARDTQLDRDVALKIPKFGSGNNVDDQELLERFYREARAAATLRSPYICPVHDVGEIDGQHYITMAYIEGRPLKDFTKSKKRHSEKQIATTVRKLAQGLSEAHEIGVVHRDLKPANVMVDKKGEPVVMDFGLARRSSSDDVQVTQSGAIMGTPAYMSPEQVEGDQDKIGPQADIYALGIIMYELITGEMPYKGSLMSILQQIALNNPEKPSKLRPDLDPRMEKICLKMMAGDLTKRYRSMEEVAADLQEVMRTPRKKSKQQASSNPSAKQTSIPTATEESNPALISIEPQSITEQLREKRGSSGSKSRRKPSGGSSSSGVNKNVLIAGGVIGLLLLMGIVFLVRVGKYDVQITLDDPSITLSVDNNKLNIKDGQNVIQLSAGPHKLQLEKDGLQTQVEEFTVTKDGKTALTAKVVNGKLDAIWEGESRLGTNKHKDEQTPQAATSPLTPETVNHALSFDGSDDHVVVDGLFLDDSDEWTIELQVSVSERSKEHERSAILAGTGQHFLALQIRYDYNHLTPFHITNGTQMEQENQAYWEPQKPYDVAIVIKGSDSFLFVNGDEKMRSTGKRVRRSFAPPKHDFLLGAGRDWHGERSLWQHFGGVIDEVRISKIARYTKDYFPEARLKNDEHTLALYHFDEGTGDILKDSSGNGHDGKIIGAKWVRVGDADAPTEGPPEPVNGGGKLASFTGGLEFSGDEDVVVFPEFRWDREGPMTIEAVVEFPGHPGSSAVYCGFEKGLQLCSKYSDHVTFLSATDRTNNVEVGPAARAEPRAYLAGVYDGKKLVLHRDELHRSVDVKPETILPDQGTFAIGRQFSGRVLAVRVSNIARFSDAPVDAPTTFTADEHTIALYHFDEGSGDVLKDSSGNGHDGKIIGAKWVRLGNGKVSNTVPDPPDQSEKIRWPLEPTRPEDIAWLQTLDASLTLRTGFDQEIDLRPNGKLPDRPATVVGVKFRHDSVESVEKVTDDVLKRLSTLGDIELLGMNFGFKTAPATKDGMAHLTSLVHLQDLNLERIGPVDTDPGFFASLPRLKRLGISREPAFPWERGVTRSSSLEEIRLHKVLPDEWKPFAQMPRLKSLSLTGMPNDRTEREAAAKHFAKIAPWCRIQVFDTVSSGPEAFTIEPTAPRPGAVTRQGSGDAPPPAVAPFDEAQAKSFQNAWARHLGEPVITTNQIGTKLAVIPPGTFKMGEGENAVDVTLTRPFRLGVYEVTQREWKAVMGTEPWRGQKETQLGDDVAATFVNWPDAAEFCQKLTQRERTAGTLREGWEYRLPTQAEWEFALRSGTTGEWAFADGKNIGDYGWIDENAKNVGEAHAHVVGQKKPSPWGLYDLHGNVWEWCSDWNSNDLQGGVDPQGPSQGSARAHRGGSWHDGAWYSRSPVRHGAHETARDPFRGFRLALAPVAGTSITKVDSSVPMKYSEDSPPPAVAPFDEAQAKAHQQVWADYLDVPVEYENHLGMKFRLIPPGEFMMGCPDDEIEWAMSKDSMADSHEPKIRSAGPQHQVALTRLYYMSTTEVTQSVYKQVMGKNPSEYSEGDTKSEDGKKVVGIDTSQFPAESMTWLDAAEFCAKLSEMEQLKPQYFRGGLITLLEGNGYRLPTEAEWEFACRAGTTTMNWVGEEQEALRASDWTGLNSGGRIHNVGQLKPNPFGLFDMLGNVWEWTGDHYEEGYYETLSGQLTVDPEGPTNDDHLRIIKGGQIHDYANARSGARSIYSRGFSREHLGFRLVLPVEAVKGLLGE